MKEKQFFLITGLSKLIIVFLSMAIIVTTLSCNQSKGQNITKIKANNNNNVKAPVTIKPSFKKSSTTPSCCKGAPSRLKLCLKSNKRM
jgi:hypothetical protein